MMATALPPATKWVPFESSGSHRSGAAPLLLLLLLLVPPTLTAPPQADTAALDEDQVAAAAAAMGHPAPRLLVRLLRLRLQLRLRPRLPWPAARACPSLLAATRRSGPADSDCR